MRAYRMLSGVARSRNFWSPNSLSSVVSRWWVEPVRYLNTTLFKVRFRKEFLEIYKLVGLFGSRMAVTACLCSGVIASIVVPLVCFHDLEKKLFKVDTCG